MCALGSDVVELTGGIDLGKWKLSRFALAHVRSVSRRSAAIVSRANLSVQSHAYCAACRSVWLMPKKGLLVFVTHFWAHSGARCVCLRNFRSQCWMDRSCGPCPLQTALLLSFSLSLPLSRCVGRSVRLSLCMIVWLSLRLRSYSTRSGPCARGWRMCVGFSRAVSWRSCLWPRTPGSSNTATECICACAPPSAWQTLSVDGFGPFVVWDNSVFMFPFVSHGLVVDEGGCPVVSMLLSMCLLEIF